MSQQIWSGAPWILSLKFGLPRATFDPRCNLLTLNSKVGELLYEGARIWNKPLIEAAFEPLSAAAILRIRPLPQPQVDKLMWKGSESGQFSIKGAYWVDQGARFGPREVV